MGEEPDDGRQGRGEGGWKRRGQHHKKHSRYKKRKRKDISIYFLPVDKQGEGGGEECVLSSDEFTGDPELEAQSPECSKSVTSKVLFSLSLSLS